MAITKRKLSSYGEIGINELKDLSNAYFPAFQSNTANLKVPAESFFDTFPTKEEIAKIPDVEITSPNGTIDIQSSIDVQTNTKTFTIDVAQSGVPYAISSGSITFTPGSYYTDGTLQLTDIKSSGIEYAYNKDGWVLKKDHVYIIAYNIIASTQGPSNESIGGRIWLDGFSESDQVWKFVLDSSYVHDESLVGTAIVCTNQDGEVHLNMRYDDNNLSSIPLADINKVEIADITSIVGQGGGTTYTAGDGINIENNVISANFSMETQTTNIPPIINNVHKCRIFTDGRVYTDNVNIGIMAPYPTQADAGKMLVANYTGSPGIGRAIWVDVPPLPVLTTQCTNIGSPSDTPYDLFTYDGLIFTFLANMNACSLRVSSTEVSSISGIVEHLSDSSQVIDGKTLINNQSITTPYPLYNMSQYEMHSTVTEVLKIKLWYLKAGTPKSVSIDVLKTGQVDLSFHIVGG